MSEKDKEKGNHGIGRFACAHASTRFRMLILYFSTFSSLLPHRPTDGNIPSHHPPRVDPSASDSKQQVEHIYPYSPPPPIPPPATPPVETIHTIVVSGLVGVAILLLVVSILLASLCYQRHNLKNNQDEAGVKPDMPLILVKIPPQTTRE